MKRRITAALAGIALAYSLRTPILSQILSLEDHTTIHRTIPLSENSIVELKHYIRNIYTPEDAINAALDYVSNKLTFRLDYFVGRRGRGYFKFTEETKKTDCVDYAFLFANSLNFITAEQGMDVNATVMRSRNARLFGKRVDSHDWVRVKDHNSGKEWDVDPTFFDVGLGWDIKKIVRD